MLPARREGAARSASGRSVSGRSQAALAHAIRPDDRPAPEELRPEDLRPEDLRPKHLRVAPKVSRRVLRQRRRARWVVAGVAVISAASMFLLVTFHVFAVQSSFQLDKLEQLRAAEQRENGLLRNLVASRSSATTIFAAATEYGMVRAPKPVLINLPNGANVSIPPATPVTMPATPYDQIASGP